MYFRVLVRTNMVNLLAVLRNFEQEGIQDMATKTWLERLLRMRMISFYLKPISPNIKSMSYHTWYQTKQKE